MKKLIFIQVFSFCSLVVFSQIKVVEDGNVGIGVDQPLSKLSIGSDGSHRYTVKVDAPKAFNGLLIERREHTGDPFGSWQFGIVSSTTLTSGFVSIGIKSSALNSTPINAGRAFGVYGVAGNSTSCYNYGVAGALYGNQNGTGILGTEDYLEMSPRIDGKYAGYFWGNVKVTGTINGVNLTNSDLRYKQNIVRLGDSEMGLRSGQPGILDNVLRLSPVEYNLKQTYFEPESDTTKLRTGIFNEESQMFKKSHFGLIAQELQEIYPNLVYEEGNGYLSIDYVGLIPILVQSIKELNAKIENLEASAISLEKNIQPEAMSVEGINNGAILYQNTPNPFTQSTQIKYYLPGTVKKASLCIYDMQGKQLKQINLTLRGEGVETISGSQFAAGIYLYALIVDGQEAGIKRMVLTE